MWHSIKGMVVSRHSLFQTIDQVFVVRGTFDIFRKMLAVLDEIDPATFTNHKKNVVFRCSRRFADHTQQTSRKLPLLLVRSTKSHITRNKGHSPLLSTCVVTEFPGVSQGTLVLDSPSS